jgi:hypothetical protein
MLINVPQYIDIEDKVAGPLTAKQLGWIVLLGVILLILWNVASKPVFFISAIPLTLLLIAMAFYKPYGQPLGSFIIFGVLYFFRPKIYFWRRTSQKEIKTPKKIQAEENYLPKKQLTSKSIAELAQLLDSEGMQHSGEIEKILKQAPVKK